MKQQQLDAASLKMLKDWADQLPVVMHQTHEVHIMTGKDLLEMGYVERDGKKIVPDEDYRYNAPVQVAANHFRRLKRAWYSNGEQGVLAYITHIEKLVQESKIVKPKRERTFKTKWLDTLLHLQSFLRKKGILQPSGKKGIQDHGEAKEEGLHRV